ncbi:hypothetical protein AMEX_G5776 [Astyanax mexicanus]|uniref:Uncharacterized protein n=1 Tax=Astyanax mexicanus TaxID=7994 RepID=A0A8T2M497_ASTMX|nr:hypothetical protein AMEX_G5776 [Astyanax mexicanus]
MSKLSLGGGANIEKNIMENYLAVSLNWCGRGEKKGIGHSRIKELVISSAMRNPQLSNPSEADAEKAIRDWFRLAPHRLHRGRPR